MTERLQYQLGARFGFWVYYEVNIFENKMHIGTLQSLDISRESVTIVVGNAKNWDKAI